MIGIHRLAVASTCHRGRVGVGEAERPDSPYLPTERRHVALDERTLQGRARVDEQAISGSLGFERLPLERLQPRPSAAVRAVPD